MKLWLISQTVATGYDTYDRAVVAAVSEQDAKEIHPGDYVPEGWPHVYHGDTWAKPEDVTAKYIGEAADGMPAGVICASFNAG